MANLSKTSLALSVIAILLGAAGLALALNINMSISNLSSQSSNLGKGLGTLTSQLEAANKNIELLAQATGVPLGNPAEVQKIIERRKLVEAAKAEGLVVAYITLEPRVMEKMIAAFKTLYPGIDVQYWRASDTGVLDRVLTEAKAGDPRFDMVLAPRATMLAMKKEGVLTRYISPDLVERHRINPLGMLYNTKLVKPEEVPKSFMDLLDLKWKGKIVMPDPAGHFSTTNWLFNLRKVLGPQWESFIKGLAKQDVLFVKSLLPAAETIVKGEKPIALTYLKYVATMRPAPIDYVRLDTFLAEVQTVGLGAKAKHPNAAKLFIDFLLSPDGQRFIAEAGEFAAAPGVYPPIKDAEKLKLVFIDDITTDQFKEWGKTFSQWITGG